MPNADVSETAASGGLLVVPCIAGKLAAVHAWADPARVA